MVKTGEAGCHSSGWGILERFYKLDFHRRFGNNIDRPGLMSTLPTTDGKGFDMLDLGATVQQGRSSFASVCYFRVISAEMLESSNCVLLLNNGTESSKGDSLRKEAYDLLVSRMPIEFY